MKEQERKERVERWEKESKDVEDGINVLNQKSKSIPLYEEEEYQPKYRTTYGPKTSKRGYWIPHPVDENHRIWIEQNENIEEIDMAELNQQSTGL